jgi:hypothetical protein
MIVQAGPRNGRHFAGELMEGGIVINTSQLVNIEAQRDSEKSSRLTMLLSVAVVGLGLITVAFALVAGTTVDPDEPTSMVAIPF